MIIKVVFSAQSNTWNKFFVQQRRPCKECCVHSPSSGKWLLLLIPLERKERTRTGVKELDSILQFHEVCEINLHPSALSCWETVIVYSERIPLYNVTIAHPQFSFRKEGYCSYNDLRAKWSTGRDDMTQIPSKWRSKMADTCGCETKTCLYLLVVH